MTSPDEDQRQAGRFINERWCTMLREAASAMTRKQLADRSQFSRAKIQSILGGQVMPRMDDLVHLAEVLQVPKLRLLAAAGYLDGIDNLITYLDQLEEQAEGVDHAAKRLTSPSMAGATRIASAILASGQYTVSIKPLWLGTNSRRRHYDDHVVIRRVDGAPIDTGERGRVEHLLHDELAWFSGGFIDGWTGNPEELAVRVPRFVAPRHSSGSPLPLLPRSIAVIGGHWAGSADVASLLAYALDYDYTHVSFTASRAFGRLTHDRHNLFRERDRLEVTRTYVEGSAIGRHRVWAADVGDSDAAVKILATSHRRPTPFVISLRPSDDLLEWTAHARALRHHTDDDPPTGLSKLREAREKVDQSLYPLSRKCQVIDVPLPTPITVDRSGSISDDGNAWFDMWVNLAEQILAKLRSRYGFSFDETQALQRLREGGKGDAP